MIQRMFRIRKLFVLSLKELIWWTKRKKNNWMDKEDKKHNWRNPSHQMNIAGVRWSCTGWENGKKGNPEIIPWRVRDEQFCEQEFMEKVAGQRIKRDVVFYSKGMGETRQTSTTQTLHGTTRSRCKKRNHHSQNKPFQWEQGCFPWKFPCVWDMHLPEGESYWEERPQCSSTSCPHFLSTNTEQAHLQIHLTPLTPVENSLTSFHSLQKCFYTSGALQFLNICPTEDAFHEIKGRVMKCNHSLQNANSIRFSGPLLPLQKGRLKFSILNIAITI